MAIQSYIQGFYWYSDSYYAKKLPPTEFHDEVILGLYDAESGGSSGELVIRWATEDAWPALQAWGPSWGVLTYFVDILDGLSTEKSVTPQKFVARLLECGVSDLTTRDAFVRKASDVEYESWIERLASDKNKRTVA